MSFVAPSRERYLFFGDTGSGKTRAVMSIARALQDNGCDAIVYIASTDMSIPRMLSGSQFSDLRNIVWEPCLDYTDTERVAKEFVKKARPQDWIVLDLADMLWDYAQDHYVDLVFGKDRTNYILEARQTYEATKAAALAANDLKTAGKGFGNPLDPRKDWTMIKSLHNNVIHNLCYRSRAHIALLTGCKPVDTANDLAELVKTFAGVGYRPAGEKQLPFHVDTCFFCVKGRDSWEMSTAKDRERVLFNKKKITNFPLQYMVAVGGWRMEDEVKKEEVVSNG